VTNAPFREGLSSIGWDFCCFKHDEHVHLQTS